MKRIAMTIAAATALAVGFSSDASATQPCGGYPFFPFGFYQPYGAQYGSSLQTPPYFALNPPVYYGARHSRPYGMSPFASPPVVSPGPGYRGRLRSDFYLPPSETVQSAPNPCISHVPVNVTAKVGKIRTNPFISDEQLVEN